METKEKVTERIVPINYAHTKTGVEAKPHDITKGELHVFERDGKPPVFVAYESPNNVGPPISTVTHKMADGMKMHYGLKPEEIKWYEKPLESKGYEQVKFREFGAEQERVGQWGECKREKEIKKEKIEETISQGIITEPVRQQRIEHSTRLDKATGPPLSVVGTPTDKEQEAAPPRRR